MDPKSFWPKRSFVKSIPNLLEFKQALVVGSAVVEQHVGQQRVVVLRKREEGPEVLENVGEDEQVFRRQVKTLIPEIDFINCYGRRFRKIDFIFF
jgi:hypothetical protein